MISIRRIQPEEGPQLRTIRLEALQESPHAFCATYETAAARSEDSWREQANGAASGPDRAIFLAIEDDRAIGITAIYRDDEAPEAAELFQVWVAPSHRGLGLAARLMDAAIEWARSSGYQSVLATVTKTNEPANSLYLKYGFAPFKKSGENSVFKFPLSQVGAERSDTRGTR